MNSFTISIHDTSFEFFNVDFLVYILMQQPEYISYEDIFAWKTILAVNTPNEIQKYTNFIDMKIAINRNFPTDLHNISYTITFTIYILPGKVKFTLYFTEDYTYSGYDINDIPSDMNLQAFVLEFKFLDWDDLKRPKTHFLLIE